MRCIILASMLSFIIPILLCSSNFIVEQQNSLIYSMFTDPAMKLTSGPYGLIFASFVPFYFDIPVSTRFRVFGVHFSDKSFIYLAGLQVVRV